MIQMKLKTKYLITSPYKFGGKKRGPSNSGSTGRKARSRKRANVVASHNSVEQYNQWKRAYVGDV